MKKKLKIYCFDIGVSYTSNCVNVTEDDAVNEIFDEANEECDLFDEDYMVDYWVDNLGENTDEENKKYFNGKKPYDFQITIWYEFSYDSKGISARDAKAKLKKQLEEDYGLQNSDYDFFKLENPILRKKADELLGVHHEKENI